MKNLALCIICISLMGCTFTSIRENDKSDIDEAKNVIDKYLNLVKEKNHIAAIDFFSKENAQTDSLGVIKYLTQVDSAKGGLINYEFIEGRSHVDVTDGKRTGEYKLLYKVFYEKESRTEKYNLIIDDQQKIKIIGIVFEIK